MQKRADIQGLRALAVLAVVLYHLGVPVLRGGFVGVDVFFAISGFLITGKLYRELDATGTVDFQAFWLGRARRLLPNACATLLAVLVATAILLPAYRQVDVSWDVGAAGVFVSNFRFAAEALDYFKADLSASPVLHFWSLSLEEQFYFALPLAMFAVTLLPRGRRPQLLHALLWVVLILSAGASLIITPVNQPVAFFEPWTRIWQLAAGGLLAINFERAERLARPLTAPLSWAGLAMIAASIILLREGDYPGAWSALPTLGALLLLLTAPSNRTLGRVLSAPVAGWLGDRSYSWYLWHWPVIVFLMPMGPWSPVLAAILSLGVAALLYKYLENPVHHGHYSAIKPRIMLLSAGLLALVITGSAGLSAASTSVTSAANLAVLHDRDDMAPSYKDGCHQTGDNAQLPPCAYGAPAGPLVVLFGDSHAAQWLSALDLATKHAGLRLRSLTKSGCPPVAATVYNEQTKTPYLSCDTWRAEVMRVLTGPDRPAVVILAGETLFSLYDHGEKCPDPGACDPLYLHGLEETIDSLRAANIAVVVISDTPLAARGVLDCLAAGKGATLCGRARSDALEGYDFAPDLAKRYGPSVPVIDLTDEICEPSFCPAERGSTIIYRDFEHLSSTFAESLWPEFVPVLGRLSNWGLPVRNQHRTAECNDNTGRGNPSRLRQACRGARWLSKG